MPNLPVRGLGMVGVVADANPYDLPVSAWSNARNLRFDADGVSRSSVFKPFLLKQTFNTPPLYVVDDSLSADAKAITTLRQDGTLSRITEGAIADVTPSTPLGVIEGNVTGTIAGSVSYINTQTGTPIAFASGEARYEPIDNWNPGDRCKSLRTYRDFLIALYVTKNTNEYPNMVKWSDAISVGTRPRWDVALENGLAGENVLNGSSGYIVDGMELGGTFLIYGSREVFRMDYIGAPFVFSFEKLFNNVSVMTQNCVVEVNSRHFVFCEDDIIMTDGITKESICDGRVKRTIFSRLDFGKRDRCRAIHNTLKSEILFAYPSNSTDASLAPGDFGCNEAAVYNYVTNTWSFVDLPNVTFGAETTQPTGTTGIAQSWDGLAKWADMKVGWSFVPSSPMSLILASAGDGDRPGDVFFYDDDINGRIINEADPETRWEAWAETTLTDFDEAGFPLNATKLVRSVTPQIVSGDPDQFIRFYINGESLTTNDSNWTNPIEFNPFRDYKINTRANGRYLSIRFEIPEGSYARLSGFDLDVIQIAGR